MTNKAGFSTTENSQHWFV